MESAKLSYAGIAGAVAGVLGLFGAVSKWYAVSLAGGTVTIKGTSDASGKLAVKSRSWAADVRESLSTNGSTDKTDKTDPPTTI